MKIHCKIEGLNRTNILNLHLQMVLNPNESRQYHKKIKVDSLVFQKSAGVQFMPFNPPLKRGCTFEPVIDDNGYRKGKGMINYDTVGNGFIMAMMLPPKDNFGSIYYQYTTGQMINAPAMRFWKKSVQEIGLEMHVIARDCELFIQPEWQNLSTFKTDAIDLYWLINK